MSAAPIIRTLVARWQVAATRRRYNRAAATLVQNLGPERALDQTSGELHEAIELYALAYYAELLIKEIGE